MEHFRELIPIRGKSFWATIGVFDGVHVGHQKIIRTMVAAAKKENKATAVITFHPHPAVVLRQLPMPFYLSTPEEKAEVFESLGVDITFTLNFTPEMASMPYQDFMQSITENLKLTQLWVGSDFALGKGRQGTTQRLSELGKQLGYELINFPHVMDNKEKISSSNIRKLIQNGDIHQANQALGRPYTIHGSVIHGDSRGRTLGFPTANLTISPEKILPPKGVYATLATLEGKVYQSVTNIGYRPTFENEKFQNRIETFIIGFSDNIYQKPMGLSFIEWLRPEMRFEDVSGLIQQIKKDVEHAEELLKNDSHTSSLLT